MVQLPLLCNGSIALQFRVAALRDTSVLCPSSADMQPPQLRALFYTSLIANYCHIIPLATI